MAYDGQLLWVPVRHGLAALQPASGETVRSVRLCAAYSGFTTPVIGRTHLFAQCGEKLYAVDRSSFAVTELGPGRGPLALDGSRLYYLEAVDFGQTYRLAAMESK